MRVCRSALLISMRARIIINVHKCAAPKIANDYYASIATQQTSSSRISHLVRNCVCCWLALWWCAGVDRIQRSAPARRYAKLESTRRAAGRMLLAVDLHRSRPPAPRHSALARLLMRSANSHSRDRANNVSSSLVGLRYAQMWEICMTPPSLHADSSGLSLSKNIFTLYTYTSGHIPQYMVHIIVL